MSSRCCCWHSSVHTATHLNATRFCRRLKLGYCSAAFDKIQHYREAQRVVAQKELYTAPVSEHDITAASNPMVCE